MAGYIPTAWFLLETRGFVDIAGVATIGFLGPILAMIFGACGSAWAISRLRKSKAIEFTNNRPYQISILNLMVGTAWIASIFAIANLLGSIEFVFAAGGWFLLHSLMVFIAKMLYRCKIKVISKSID